MAGIAYNVFDRQGVLISLQPQVNKHHRACQQYTSDSTSSTVADMFFEIDTIHSMVARHADMSHGSKLEVAKA